jgi:3-oxoadipate enol-lactonase
MKRWMSACALSAFSLSSLAAEPATVAAQGGAGAPQIEARLAQAAPQGLSRRVQTPAGELVVREVGHGAQPVVLWHALYAEASMFDALVMEMGADYRFLIVSAPGHGGSGLPAGPLTSSSSGAAVLAVLDAWGLERAAVVGCSWGGIAAIQAALQAPSRISAVAAFNTPLGPGQTDLGTRAIVAMTGWFGDTAFFGRRVASDFFSNDSRAHHPERIERFAEAFSARDARPLQSAARAVLMERESLVPLLGALKVPALVVSGEEDSLYPPAQTRALVDGVAAIRFARVSNSAHLTPLEQPQRSAQLIRELLGAAGASASATAVSPAL